VVVGAEQALRGNHETSWLEKRKIWYTPRLDEFISTSLHVRNVVLKLLLSEVVNACSKCPNYLTV
jgi:hypothetical protein